MDGIRIRAHQIVFQAFFGPVPKGKVIDHVDERQWNNSPMNFCLVTPEFNVMKSAIMSKRQRLTADMVQVVKELRAFGFGCTDICTCLGLSEATVSVASRSTLDGRPPMTLKLHRTRPGVLR